MKIRLVALMAIAVFMLSACGQSGDMPENVSKLNNLGFYYAQQGDMGEAKDHFRRVLEIDMSHETARKNLALLHFQTKNFTAAEEHFRTLTQLYPDNATYHYNLGIAIAEKCRVYQKCDLQEAISEFEKTEELRPGYEMAKENMEALRKIMNDSAANSTNSTG